MRRQQDGAVGTIAKRLKILCILAGQNLEARGPAAQEVERLVAVGATILQSNDVGMSGKLKQRVIGKIDSRPVGDVVEDDRKASTVGQRFKVVQKAALRWPRVIR